MTLKYSAATPVSDSLRQELLDFALEIAVPAGRATLAYFRNDVQVSNKLDGGRFDPVTEADHAAEKVLRELIEARYPEHGVFGEEFGHQEGSGLTWVIDPIDGTRAFMSGMVHWGLILGLFDGERPIVGVMYQPFTDELFFGDGRVAGYRRGSESRALKTRACGSLADAVLTTTTPNLFRGPAEHDGFRALEGSVKLCRYGGDCYIYAMLAMGQVDLATDAGLNPYDIQGLIPVIEGAGGVVTTWSGEPAAMGGTVLAAGSREIHQLALEMVNG